jgi:hypothetical protein
MKIYKEKDYKGEFNLLKMERGVMVKALKLCRGKRSAAAHQIEPKEYFN